MHMTHAEYMTWLTERATHCTTMRPLSPFESELLKDMEAHAASLSENEREYWIRLPIQGERQ